MNYIYDIYLNLNEVLYDFYDWNKNDKIIHIKKIPIIKINTELFKKLIYNKVNICQNLLNKIYNKTEIWTVNNKILYCALFTDGSDIIAIEFNNKGNSIRKSQLFIDEEIEILEIISKLNESDIEFKILKKDKYVFKTRKQIKDENFINHELNNMEQSKLSYIFFECFGKQENNRKIILDKIKKISKNSNTYKNLYDILKLTSSTRK